MAGYDSLGVGGVHGDMIRNIMGVLAVIDYASAVGVTATGAFALDKYTNGPPSTDSASGYQASFSASRVGPVGSANKPRAWGALACCYLGTPVA